MPALCWTLGCLRGTGNEFSQSTMPVCTSCCSLSSPQVRTMYGHTPLFPTVWAPARGSPEGTQDKHVGGCRAVQVMCVNEKITILLPDCPSRSPVQILPCLYLKTTLDPPCLKNNYQIPHATANLHFLLTGSHI